MKTQASQKGRRSQAVVSTHPDDGGGGVADADDREAHRPVVRVVLRHIRHAAVDDGGEDPRDAGGAAAREDGADHEDGQRTHRAERQAAEQPAARAEQQPRLPAEVVRRTRDEELGEDGDRGGGGGGVGEEGGGTGLDGLGLRRRDLRPLVHALGRREPLALADDLLARRVKGESRVIGGFTVADRVPRQAPRAVPRRESGRGEKK